LNVYLETVDNSELVCCSLGEIMGKHEYMAKLIGMLTKFTKDRSDWSPGDPISLDSDFSIILNDAIPVEVKAIVYEIQISILLGMSHQRIDVVKGLCEKALAIYEENVFPIRRVRVIERMLYTFMIQGDSFPNALEIGNNALQILAPKAFGKDDGLTGSKKLLLARCFVWMGLLHDFSNESQNEYFSQALSIWIRWLEKPNQENQDKEQMIQISYMLGTFSLIKLI
jgi:hypothetical protein